MTLRRTGQALAAVSLAAVLAGNMGGCAKPRQEAQPLEPGSGAAGGTVRVWLPCGLAEWVGKFDDLMGQGAGGPKIEYQIINAWGLADRLKTASPKPDLIIMPGDRELAALEAAGLLDAKPSAWALNKIAVLTPKSNPARIEQFSDLAKASSIVVAPADTSQGYYARQALEKAGLLDTLQGRLVAPPTPGDIYRFLAEGKAEVGLSYAGCSLPPVYQANECPVVEPAGEKTAPDSDASGPAMPKEKLTKVMVLGPVPEEYCPAFPAMVGVVKGAPNKVAAYKALGKLTGEDAQEKIAEWMPGPAWHTPRTGRRTELHMYCGAALRPPVEKLARIFEERNPNVKLNVAYAGSGCLLAQLTFARRGDLYMPGEHFYLDQADERGFLVERKHIAYFLPVILVAKGNPKKVAGLKDFLRKDLKVAIGEPEACAGGRLAKQVFERMGIWDEFQGLPARRALNIPELAYWVSIGTVDAAIVWMAQAKQFAKYCDHLPIPAKLYEPVEISVGLLKFSKHPEAARGFMQLLASPEGQKIFEEEGYPRRPSQELLSKD
ncbi:MAG: molybdate ABC transporter substrate-binding protein [Armatimonadetes bacterium]|nr:molybdate ABC transporter substrate-binding protein [Armatimonadota bacterium]